MPKFIEYEKALLQIEGHSIFAESAQLGVDVPLTPARSVTGSLIRYAADGPIRGTLTFTHYLTGVLHDFLNPLTAVEWTGEPLGGNFGGVQFSSGYIKGLEFSVAPFEPISVQSTMDIYGELTFLESGRSDAGMRNERQISHGAKSYVAGDNIGINNKLTFDYSVSCDRNPVMLIGSGLPSRVTKENVRINMTVRGENLGNVLLETGNAATLTANIYDAYGDPAGSALDTFVCTGQIFSQSLAGGDRNNLVGSISMSQDYLTGKAVK
tara:strand:- start:1374 stop:2174 length:801 start_codon:yes stop_codon:yes gene_type:complete